MRQLLKRTILALFFVVMTSAGALVVAPATAQAQVGVHIGVDIPVFPRLVVIPGYPVYHAPDVRANYFFYDGLFWVFNVDDGYWYSSSWYNGPWVVVEPEFVPQPILVVPYRYYRVRPAYWGGWAYDRPPRWDVYWGPRWVEHHHGWDHWDRNRRWTAAPLPVFQRDFPRDRYPSPDRQVTIYRERYNYKPRDVVVREHHTTIIDRQSRGGDRARARADYIERPREGQLREQQRDQRQATDRANNQQKEALRQQDRSQRDANRHQQEDLRQQDRAQRQGSNQRQEDLKQQDRAQREAVDRANRQRQEDLKQQDKARRESNSQAERAQRNAGNQRQEDLRQQDRAQRQANVQANRQRQENAQQQDKARREANVQAQREQRQASAQANRQRQENVRQQDRVQQQAGAHQDRSQRQANVQERGRDRDNKGAPEKGERG